MRLRIAKPFNDPENIFELKHGLKMERPVGGRASLNHHRHIHQPAL
jgi:hypothetical protein